MAELIIFSLSFALTSIFIAFLYRVFKNRNINCQSNLLYLYYEKYPSIGVIGILINFTIFYILFPFAIFNLKILLYLYALALIGFMIDFFKIKSKFYIIFLLIINFFYIIPSFPLINSYWGIFCLSFLATLIIYAFDEMRILEGFSSSLLILIQLSFYFLFLENSQFEESIVAISMIGSVLAFKRYNIFPSKLLPGTSTSLIFGGFCIITMSLSLNNSQSIYIAEKTVVINLLILLIPIIFVLWGVMKNIFKIRIHKSGLYFEDAKFFIKIDFIRINYTVLYLFALGIILIIKNFELLIFLLCLIVLWITYTMFTKVKIIFFDTINNGKNKSRISYNSERLSKPSVIRDKIIE